MPGPGVPGAPPSAGYDEDSARAPVQIQCMVGVCGVPVFSFSSSGSGGATALT